MKLILLVCSLTGVLCYYPSGKESILSNIFLHDLVNRITNGKQELSSNGDVSYLDLTGDGDTGMPMDGRALSRELEEEQMFPLDYDNLGEFSMMHPSIRDQEYLQHSSLWGNQYNLGPSDPNVIPQGMKFNKPDSESTLPAYCNPPNPCPVGYKEDQGCIEDFENTASFSRRYQAMQDCMCDSEHMFDCPNLSNPSVKDRALDSMGQLDFGRLLQQTLKDQNDVNPFLTGEKLPVAAKKGINTF